MKKLTSTQIVKRLQEIASEGCGVFSTDAGQGCAGPLFLYSQDIYDEIEAGEFRNTEIVPLDKDLFVDTVLALHQDIEKLLRDEWTQVEYGWEDSTSNPYHKILWIWLD